MVWVSNASDWAGTSATRSTSRAGGTKPAVLSIVVTLVAALIAGLGGSVSAQEATAAASDAESALHFWPLADGSYWTFSGFGLELTLVVEQLGPNEFRVDGISNDFIVQREYYEIVDGDLVATRREMAAGTTVFDPPQPFIKTPFAPDRLWTWQGELDGELVTSTFLVMDMETVETPVGTFEAFPVAITMESGGEGLMMMRWFAPGVGIVREQAGLNVGGQAVMLDMFLTDYGVR